MLFQSLQHIFDKNAVTPGAVLHQDMCDRADEFAVLDDGAAAQGLVNNGVKDFSRFMKKNICMCRKNQIIMPLFTTQQKSRDSLESLLS